MRFVAWFRLSVYARAQTLYAFTTCADGRKNQQELYLELAYVPYGGNKSHLKLDDAAQKMPVYRLLYERAHGCQCIAISANKSELEWEFLSFSFFCSSVGRHAFI